MLPLSNEESLEVLVALNADENEDVRAIAKELFPARVIERKPRFH
jgi:hypothetical protein